MIFVLYLIWQFSQAVQIYSTVDSRPAIEAPSSSTSSFSVSNLVFPSRDSILRPIYEMLEIQTEAVQKHAKQWAMATVSSKEMLDFNAGKELGKGREGTIDTELQLQFESVELETS